MALSRGTSGGSFADFLEKYSVFVAKADFKFNAAHFVAYDGFREKLHGHNYTVAVHFEAEGIQADGYVIDFGDIKAVVKVGWGGGGGSKRPGLPPRSGRSS